MAAALPARLRADLGDAMRARDSRRVAVLRTTLSAIANAEAVPTDADTHPPTTSLVDHPRRQLSDADVEQVLRSEVDDREDTIGMLVRAGRDAEADELAAELEILRGYLVSPQPSGFRGRRRPR